MTKIFTPPGITWIGGEWKSGKTDLGLELAVDLALDKWKIVSKVGANIQCEDKRVDYVADLITLKHWLHKDRSKKLYVFDEAIKFAYKRTPMDSKQVALIQIITEISKGHARAIMIAQDVTMVDKDLVNPIFTRAIILKKGFFKRDQFLLSSYLIPGGTRTFRGIPRTTVKFHPYEEAEFEERPEGLPTANPDFQIFYRWVRGESIYKLAKEQDVNPNTVREICMKVGRVLMENSALPPDQMDKAIGPRRQVVTKGFY